MNILGIFLIIIMPFALGTVINFITRQKETNQIETYLIGFFSFFLMQGVVFSLYNFVHVPYETCCKIFTYANYGILACFLIIAIFGFKTYIIKNIKSLAIRKEERLIFAIMIFAMAVVICRIVFLYSYERDDMMLETVRINLLSNTVNTYNPLTGRPYELGLINSKKLITMPLYYTYWCVTYGIEARVLLYLVCTLQTFFCVFMAIKCTMTAIVKTKRKQYLCSFFVAVLLASGDYFKGAVGYKVLWNGYDGMTIVVAVMMAYIIYLVMDIYRLERGDYGVKTLGGRLIRVFRIMICFACTLFMSGIATGFLLLALCLFSMIICASLRFGKEEKS